jgi:hypothetical protein
MRLLNFVFVYSVFWPFFLVPPVFFALSEILDLRSCFQLYSLYLPRRRKANLLFPSLLPGPC